MSYRAKQATVALNLLAIVMVGLLYRMDGTDDHIADQKAFSRATNSKSTISKDEKTSPVLEPGIKMVSSDLPAPPPVAVAGVTSTEVVPATSNVPAVTQNVTMQPEIQSKLKLIPMKVSIASPQSNLALKNSLAKSETVAPSPKTSFKSDRTSEPEALSIT